MLMSLSKRIWRGTMFRKKLYYSVLIPAVLLALRPVWAAEIHVSTWAELKSAVENGVDGAGAGGTVYLDKNIVVPNGSVETITTAVPGIVIDGQGNSISNETGGNFLKFSSSTQTDLQIKNVVFDTFNGSGTITLPITNQGKLGYINADFINNYLEDSLYVHGGAIYNTGTIDGIKGDFIENSLQTHSNRGDGNGGAISNNGTIKEIKGNFIGNYVGKSSTGKGHYSSGGAIYNMGNIGSITGDFTDNYTLSGDVRSSGGAIFSEGSISNITGNFTGNYAQTDATNGEDALGGAIYNKGMMSLTNSNFYDNYAQTTSGDAFGGAIYNQGTLTITADNGVSEFSGNKVIHNDENDNQIEDYEAIYNAGSLTLNAVNNGIIRFDDKINGVYVDIEEELSDGGRYDVVSDNAGGYYVYDGENLQIHLAWTESGYMMTNYSDILQAEEVEAELEWYENQGAQITQQGDDYHIVMDGQEVVFHKTEDGYVMQLPADLPGITITGDESGRVEFGNEVKDQTLYLQGDVTAVMKSGSDFSTSGFNTFGGKISLIDEAINRFSPKELNLMSGVTRLGLDIDLANKTGDFITADTINLHGGSLFIDELNILSDETSPNTKVAVIDTKDGLSEQTSLKEGIEAYGPIYKYDASYDKTTGEIEFVNAGMAESGTSGGDVNYGDLNPDVTTVPVSTNAGVYISQANVYREALGNTAMMPVSPAGLASGDVMAGRAWMRPFMSDEEVSLDNGPKVDNRVWGMLVGLDSRKVYFDNCWDGVFSGYVGTTGSRQKYDGVRINQKAAVLGASAMFKRGEFWTGLTANVMYGDGKAHTRFGTDDFHNLSTGFAMKAGRNFYLGDGFTLQPSFMGSYTYVKTSDYTTSAGVDIDSDAIQIVQLTPGLRLMWDVGNGWMPYIGYSYYWNLVDDSKVKANNVVLPEISVKPYSEYALGVIKEWDVVDSYFQLVYRNGGREGIDLQAGVSYEF